ncbi:MAG: V-type ATP synthase alpha chain [Planctomycetes bacterium ADurb.Bin126]|nr:MAG: V-type ATP synthase alpha chain [Planctomycetes bacterium ADurb.Bin126]HOD84115.1 V-type ATP synthase subunit A [Phycisphaerae bacterium]HQL73607.1 V-type ATP synthase subunit A [Phycisphaerae bacterium]
MTGRIVAVYGNMVIAETSGRVIQNSVAYCCRDDGARLLSEVIRIRGRLADLQVFEETRGLKVGNAVDFEEEMLSVELGPGLLGQIYDGLQNPLPNLAQEAGYFLKPGVYIRALDSDRKWDFTPLAKPGQTVTAGETLGTVPEGIFTHRIMAPFALTGSCKVESVVSAGQYTIEQEIAVLVDESGKKIPVKMVQSWPVKRALNVSRRRLMPEHPLVTRVRIIDSMFPILRGGTYCIPGPFGAGKTVLQQITSRHAEIDIVIIAACGERAGEVVETLREFPHLQDPRTGKSLMERTIIICNTSAMPVAAREASVYTAATLAEYYRQMGLNVLLLADSTSRWAQAMREVSGRLEEIPGEEAFPAYLESRIAGFYERAGALELKDGQIGTLTIGGTVSPAGGNFEEPVTQGTLKVVGAFHGLSRARSDARRYPAIDPLDSWSKYSGIIDPSKVIFARAMLRRGSEVQQMMTVVGEEGTSVEDFSVALKAEFFDNCYLQQNAYDEVDAATPAERQKFVFDKVLQVLELDFGFDNKEQARKVLVAIGDLFRNWNYAAWDSDEFKKIQTDIDRLIEAKGRAEAPAEQAAEAATA